MLTVGVSLLLLMTFVVEHGGNVIDLLSSKTTSTDGGSLLRVESELDGVDPGRNEQGTAIEPIAEERFAMRWALRF